MTLDECDRLFAQVRSAAGLAEACHAINAVLDAYELLEFSFVRGQTFWRARHCDGSSPWPAAREMFYPPPEHTRAQRLNDDGRPLLYAATHPDTALAEISAAEGGHVQVAAFRIRPDKEVRMALVGEYAHQYKAGYPRVTGHDRGGVLGSMVAKDYVERRDHLYIDAFLGELLSAADAEANGYRFTRALASLVFADQDTEGFFYPSVKDKTGTNLALRPGAADEKLSMVACWQGRVDKNRSYGFVDCTVLRQATHLAESGEFVWTEDVVPNRLAMFDLTKTEYEEARDWDAKQSIPLACVRGRSLS